MLETRQQRGGGDTTGHMGRDQILSVSVQSLASQLTLLQFAQISDVWQFTNGSIVDHATN